MTVLPHDVLVKVTQCIEEQKGGISAWTLSCKQIAMISLEYCRSYDQLGRTACAKAVNLERVQTLANLCRKRHDFFGRRITVLQKIQCGFDTDVFDLLSGTSYLDLSELCLTIDRSHNSNYWNDGNVSVFCPRVRHLKLQLLSDMNSSGCRCLEETFCSSAVTRLGVEYFGSMLALDVLKAVPGSVRCLHLGSGVMSMSKPMPHIICLDIDCMWKSGEISRMFPNLKALRVRSNFFVSRGVVRSTMIDIPETVQYLVWQGPMNPEQQLDDLRHLVSLVIDEEPCIQKTHPALQELIVISLDELSEGYELSLKDILGLKYPAANRVSLSTDATTLDSQWSRILSMFDP